jgi:hypothetical protein
MAHIAYLAAGRVIDRTTEADSFTPERTDVLYISGVLLGQYLSVHEKRASGLVLPEFQEALGEDLQALLPAIREALAGQPKLVLTPRGESTKRLVITEEPDEDATMCIPAHGVPGAFPAAFVAAVAAYGLAYTSGQEFWPIVGIDHVCEGTADEWLELLHQAEEACRHPAS